MSEVPCQQCDGRGHITTMEPKPLGRCSNGEPVSSRFTVPINRVCGACTGMGTVATTPATSEKTVA